MTKLLSPIFPSNDLAHPGLINPDVSNKPVITNGIDNYATKSPLIVSCPHAGIHIPSYVFATLDVSFAEVLSRGDRFTDWLTVTAPNHGATQIISTIAPSILNVGRDFTSIDPAQVRGGLTTLESKIDKYTENGIGQGIVSTKTLLGGGKPIYKAGQEPDENEIDHRIRNFYWPFHEALEDETLKTIEQFGYALIFDIHSAPSKGTHADPDLDKERADIIFSNNPNALGVSADNALLNTLTKLAQNHGLSVTLNDPYKGGFVTQKFGENGEFGNEHGSQAFQIEYNRAAIGINEDTLELIDKAKFASVQKFTDEMLAYLSRYALEHPYKTALS